MKKALLSYLVVFILALIVMFVLQCCASHRESRSKETIKVTLVGNWGKAQLEATDVDSIKIDTLKVK